MHLSHKFPVWYLWNFPILEPQNPYLIYTFYGRPTQIQGEKMFVLFGTLSMNPVEYHHSCA